MAPRIKVDEDLPEGVATIFTVAGYEATTIRRQGWSGLTDEDLWPRVQAERRWLVTADKAFGDIRLFAQNVSVAFFVVAIRCFYRTSRLFSISRNLPNTTRRFR